MKNKIYNLIASLASLVLGVILLVFVCLAWYVTNSTAKAEGVAGITGKGDFYDISLTRYLANETIREGQPTIYKMGNQLNTTNENAVRYDELSGYTKVIYKISFKTKVKEFSLAMNNASNRTNDFVLENEKYYNYLSNVAVFSILKVSGSDSKVIIEDTANPITSETSFVIEGQNITNNTYPTYSCHCNSLLDPNENYHTNNIDYSNTNITEEKVTSIFLLFEYNKDHINQLYSLNLGIDAQIIFKDDIAFILS